MRQKVEKISQKLVDILSQWSVVKTITLAEAAEEEMNSPYFFLSIDVFYKGTLPSLEKRRASFSDTATFESSDSGNKDRFLYEGTPVRLEYKNMDRIELLFNGKKGTPYVIRESGTYLFYRIKNNRVLFQKSGWLNDIRSQISELAPDYWKPLIQTCAASLEHQMADLAASVIAEDDFFYLRSLSGFVNTLCSLMFLFNREFEPSGRRVIAQLYGLKDLTENFRGRFECLIKEDSEFGPERKKEIAQLITSQVLAMIQE